MKKKDKDKLYQLCQKYIKAHDGKGEHTKLNIQSKIRTEIIYRDELQRQARMRIPSLRE